MNIKLQLFMPRVTVAAFTYAAMHLPISKFATLPSLALGAVISSLIRKLLRDPEVDAWNLEEAIARLTPEVWPIQNVVKEEEQPVAPRAIYTNRGNCAAAGSRRPEAIPKCVVD